jgi:hypothetical protein
LITGAAIGLATGANVVYLGGLYRGAKFTGGTGRNAAGLIGRGGAANRGMGAVRKLVRAGWKAGAGPRWLGAAPLFGRADAVIGIAINAIPSIADITLLFVIGRYLLHKSVSAQAMPSGTSEKIQLFQREIEQEQL